MLWLKRSPFPFLTFSLGYSIVLLGALWIFPSCTHPGPLPHTCWSMRQNYTPLPCAHIFQILLWEKSTERLWERSADRLFLWNPLEWRREVFACTGRKNREEFNHNCFLLALPTSHLLIVTKNLCQEDLQSQAPQSALLRLQKDISGRRKRMNRHQS